MLMVAGIAIIVAVVLFCVYLLEWDKVHRPGGGVVSGHGSTPPDEG
jgi:hypothetical protein